MQRTFEVYEVLEDGREKVLMSFFYERQANVYLNYCETKLHKNVHLRVLDAEEGI